MESLSGAVPKSDQILRKYQVRTLSPSGYDIIYHDDSAGKTYFSRDVFADYDDAVNESNRLQSGGEDNLVWWENT